ncbi:helix-turn-helix domain-containing protein [Kutzneria kofuensis]|uniref:DNA-binding transcriptional ArsR family regulator n=1 Tax=Kutzneria kofuensis TaxID=103725 RepID=A0A7W9KD70_9PSEU|nr:helix-turn-helix domain-containing protein [Kutzneria kofuensis]MBB5889639.1 DNA-binding transcriptional ArsR family regulator [Kutzneria kofuensis]
MTARELLAHPVRMRIVHALRGRALTTGRLCELLPDVSKAMVYRHVEALAAGEVLEVAEERRVRGAVERTFRLRDATIDTEDLTVDDYRRGFDLAMATLLAEFTAYLDRDGVDPTADLVGFRQHAIWLSRPELEELIADLRKVIVPRLGNGPGGDRSRYLLSPILFPGEALPTDG